MVSAEAGTGQLALGSSQKRPDALQHGRIHRFGHAPSLRILLARMINAKEPRQIVGENAFGSVGKTVGGARCDLPTLFKKFQVSIPSNFPERQHGTGTQNFQFTLEIPAAMKNFERELEILRPRAVLALGKI